MTAAADMRNELERLMAERTFAAASDLSDNDAYMTDLEEELEATEHAYVGLAVTEIASLRAELSGPLLG